MVFRVVKTVTAEFTKEEREILHKANGILMHFAERSKEVDEVPMEDEDVIILENLYEYIKAIQDVVCYKED